MANNPEPTPRAILQPRASTGTFCWHSLGTTTDGTTVWTPVTFDPEVPFITSLGTFPIWIEWCGMSWCATSTVPTTCGDGVVMGQSYTAECPSAQGRCLTESMYQRYGDATPKLSKVWCDDINRAWVPRTYFIESPPAKGIGED